MSVFPLGQTRLKGKEKIHFFFLKKTKKRGQLFACLLTAMTDASVKLNTELFRRKTYKKSFHSVHFGKRWFLCTTKNTARCFDAWELFNHLLFKKKKRRNIAVKATAANVQIKSCCSTNAYIAQCVWEVVQIPLPSWAQSVWPVLTAALWKHRPCEQQPQCQDFCSHSEDKASHFAHEHVNNSYFFPFNSRYCCSSQHISDKTLPSVH